MSDNDKKNEHEHENENEKKALNKGEANDETPEPTISDSETHAADFQDHQSDDPHESDEESDQQQKSAHNAKQEELKKAFGGTSKVGGRESFLKKKSSWIILFVGGVILVIMMGGHHAKEKKNQAAAKIHAAQLMHSAVQQRLDREKNKQNSVSPRAAQEKGLSGEALMDDGAYTKEMIARMNAPTSIYEGGTSQSGGNNQEAASSSDSGVAEATFIGKGANQEFGNATYQTTSVDAKQVPHPESTIVSGEMIHATLNVAMNSDLPGMVTATVTSPAYSYTGDNELIPRGSRLIGQYSSAVLQGQDRIFIMWNRLVLPNGISVDINSPDTDSIGQAGEPADYINRHFWSRFGESILLSILSAGVSNVDVQSSDQYNSAQAYRMGIAESLQASATGTLQQTISLKPTLVRYQGATINVFIAHNLSFYNVLNQGE